MSEVPLYDDDSSRCEMGFVVVARPLRVLDTAKSTLCALARELSVHLDAGKRAFCAHILDAAKRAVCAHDRWP